MKKALNLLYDKLKTCNIDFKFVANIHDEWQVEVKEHQANQAGQLAVESIRDAGEYFNMRCPLDGERAQFVMWYLWQLDRFGNDWCMGICYCSGGGSIIDCGIDVWLVDNEWKGNELKCWLLLQMGHS